MSVFAWMIAWTLSGVDFMTLLTVGLGGRDGLGMYSMMRFRVSFRSRGYVDIWNA
jgi:hypothetical protein